MQTTTLSSLLDDLLQIGFDATTVRLQIRKANGFGAEPLPAWTRNLASGLRDRLRLFDLLDESLLDDDARLRREQTRTLVDRTLSDLSSLSH